MCDPCAALLDPLQPFLAGKQLQLRNPTWECLDRNLGRITSLYLALTWKAYSFIIVVKQSDKLGSGTVMQAVKPCCQTGACSVQSVSGHRPPFLRSHQQIFLCELHTSQFHSLSHWSLKNDGPCRLCVTSHTCCPVLRPRNLMRLLIISFIGGHGSNAEVQQALHSSTPIKLASHNVT